LPKTASAQAHLKEFASARVGTDRHHFLGRLGLGTRSIGERSISSSTTSHLKNCCRPLCLFSAVEARPDFDHPRLERLDVGPRDTGRIIGGVVGVRVG
jgi:hypothetical protein